MLYDKDEDGSITMAELGVVMRSLGQRPSGDNENAWPNFFNKFLVLSLFPTSACWNDYTETELRKMVLVVDQNDNGMIEFNEFLQIMSNKMREGDNEDELKEAFKWD